MTALCSSTYLSVRLRREQYRIALPYKSIRKEHLEKKEEIWLSPMTDWKRPYINSRPCHKKYVYQVLTVLAETV